jgi:nucleotide sugar dehydrogenase
MRVGIVGLGFVGGSVRQWFERYTDHEMFYFDLYKNIGSVEEVNKAEVIFVAVPTPFHANGDNLVGYNDAAVLEALANITDGHTVVIKSTVMPGTTRRLQEMYPNKTILFNPEFLRELTAYDDFNVPDRQIIGYARTSDIGEAYEVLRLLPDAPYKKVLLSDEAELVKYFGNVFLASKVIFANQMFDICSAVGVSYNSVKDAAAKDPRIGDSHLNVHDLGYRGYGGHCFPKDTRALRQFARSLGVDTDFLDSMERINKRLTGGVDR